MVKSGPGEDQRPRWGMESFEDSGGHGDLAGEDFVALIEVLNDPKEPAASEQLTRARRWSRASLRR